MTTKNLYTSDTHQELVEKYMISRFLKADVVLEDLIALGKELKIVTMDEFKWSEGLNIRYLFLTGYLCCCLTKISDKQSGQLPMKIWYA